MAATKADWGHWGLILGAEGDLLPVAPAGSPPTEHSKIEAFGKVPSALTPDGRAFGIAKWTKKVISAAETEMWSNDSRLSICVRASAIRAFDIDITDEPLALEIGDIFRTALRDPIAVRTRANSTKFLIPFRLAGQHTKRIIDCGESGRIELLGDGQQWLAVGQHESGVPYEWVPSTPYDIPELTLEEVDRIWTELEQFGVAKPTSSPETAAPAVLATEIPTADLDILQSALTYPPLVSAAADNDAWSEVGYALLSTQCYTLWEEFCQRAPNYQTGDALAWWRAHQDAEPCTDYSHIVKMAKELGFQMAAFGVLTEEELIADHDSPSSIAEYIGSLPDKHYDTTDLSNAHRLKDAFGGQKIIVVHGIFHSWTGKYWRASESEAFRSAADLTNLLQIEITNAQAKFDSLIYGNQGWIDLDIGSISRPDQSQAVKQFRATATGGQILAAAEHVDALRKWQKACEQVAVQNRAVELLKKTMEPYDPIILDSPRYLFNVLNGTIDLRSGLLLPHEPRDFITKISRTEYAPGAECPIFEAFILDIFAGDTDMVSFMQRWFGYAMTAETREQKILLHIGGGSNGKSTLLDAISRVMGEYGKTAAPNLLTAQNDRHPTEIAELFGRRLVTAHESDDGAILRESFIKQATGGDMLSGRFMRQDFFEFAPTHKLQLLTNHKPQVRGQDHAIWRRILLVWYSRRYGSEAAVTEGSANALGDQALGDKLELERKGILAWMVRGAIEWYKQGLNPPLKVAEAGREYQNEQDRMAMFVEERCFYEASAWSAIDSLYSAYASWARSSGYNSLSKQKFVTELERVMGQRFNRSIQRSGKSTAKGVKGIQLDPDGAGGGVRFLQSVPEDLL